MFSRHKDESGCYPNRKWVDSSLGVVDQQDLADWISELVEGSYLTGLPSGRNPRASVLLINSSYCKAVTVGVLCYANEQHWISDNVAGRPRSKNNQQWSISSVSYCFRGLGTGKYYSVNRYKGWGLSYPFLTYTGCRIGGSFALRIWDNLLDEGRARINWAWNEARIGIWYGCSQNGNPRTIAISVFTILTVRQMCLGRLGTDYTCSAGIYLDIWS